MIDSKNVILINLIPLNLLTHFCWVLHLLKRPNFVNINSEYSLLLLLLFWNNPGQEKTLHLCPTSRGLCRCPSERRPGGEFKNIVIMFRSYFWRMEHNVSFPCPLKILCSTTHEQHIYTWTPLLQMWNATTCVCIFTTNDVVDDWWRQWRRRWW